MSANNQALSAALAGVLANCFDAAEAKQDDEKAFRAGVLQMLMRCAVALESIAAGNSAARADAHAAASEDAASMAGTSGTACPPDGEAAPKAAAEPSCTDQSSVVTALRSEEAADGSTSAPVEKAAEQPAETSVSEPEKDEDPSPEFAPEPAAKAEAPAVVTARVEEQKEKAKAIAPRVDAQMKISAAYKDAAAAREVEPLSTYIRAVCGSMGFKSFGVVPDEKLPDVVTAVVAKLNEVE